ncbi:MAG: hypothetical protein RMY33_001795 [Nostoc sp. DedQUE03]|nr:hypothetical protein [Nostoc sp. DedQUE02]
MWKNQTILRKIKWTQTLFPPIDALCETLRVACFSEGVRGLALTVRAASRREAMPKALPLAEKALRYAILPHPNDKYSYRPTYLTMPKSHTVQLRK